jgi:uncharacterized membrane protein
MNDNPVQVLVAAFNDPNRAAEIMGELKQGKKAGLIGIIDAAVVVKDADGKLKVKDAKRRSTKGMITGGVVGGVLGLLAGPVGLLAVGGGAIGALAGKASGSALKAEMKEIGTALTPNSSAIVAIIEHTWVTQMEAMLARRGRTCGDGFTQGGHCRATECRRQCPVHGDEWAKCRGRGTRG